MSPERLTPLQAFIKLRPEFDHLPGLALGATDSAHEVFFGIDGEQKVGVKAFIDNEGRTSSNRMSPSDRAEHEKEMLERVRKLGFYTLKPLRVVESARGNMAFLVTSYEPNLTTMSTVVQDSSEAREKSRTKRLISTARTLGELHIFGISHGDSQIKNFAICPSYPGVMVFDFEKGGTDNDGHIKSSPYLHDLESLVQSLAHKSYGGEHTGRANELVYDHVIEPYIDTVKHTFRDDIEEMRSQAIDTHYDKHKELHSSGFLKRGKKK